MAKKVRKKLSLGKKLGLFAFLLSEVIVITLFFFIKQKDLISLAYIQLAIFSITWGAKSFKVFMDGKNGNGGNNG